MASKYSALLLCHLLCTARQKLQRRLEVESNTSIDCYKCLIWRSKAESIVVQAITVVSVIFPSWDVIFSWFAIEDSIIDQLVQWKYSFGVGLFFPGNDLPKPFELCVCVWFHYWWRPCLKALEYKMIHQRHWWPCRKSTGEKYDGAKHGKKANVASSHLFQSSCFRNVTVHTNI